MPQPVVQARSLRKEYGGLVAVRDVDLTIEQGQVWGLIGPNGAGKTTLLKMLATLLRPTAGELKVLGHSTRTEYEKARKSLGYMPDFFNLYDGLTLDECVRFFGRCYEVPESELEKRATEALDYVGLSEKQFEPIQNLSRGMTQRLGVANLLVHDPPLILLDEPASGLDPVARIRLRRVLTRLADEGKTVVISSHILSELDELCTHVCAMNRGEIIASGNIQLLTKGMASSVLSVGIVAEDGGAASDALVERALSIARALPSVQSAEKSSKGLRLTTASDGLAHAQLNAALVSQGIPVSSLVTEEGGLESLFALEASGDES
jgi:ABC-2 type transport system ATP-binding protein